MRTARVGDLAEQVRGVTFSKADAVSTPRDGYLPVLTATNIQDGLLATSDLTYVPASKVRSRQRLRIDDVVVCTSSGSLSVVGKAARNRGEIDGGFGAFLKVLRPGSEVDPGYFAHFFQTPGYRRKISGLAAGANINNLRNEHLDELVLPYPYLPEQRRIAAILDHADALRAKRRHVLAHLDTLTQSIFHDMFGDPISNERGLPVHELAEWIDETRPITYGILKPGPETEGGVPYIRVADMKDGGIALGHVRRTTHEIDRAYRRSTLRSGDLLMSIRGHVGRFATIPDEMDGANITQDSARLAIRDGASHYVRAAMESPSIQHWMARRTIGAAVQGINLGSLRKAPLPRPPGDEMREFADRVDAVRRQCCLARRAQSVNDELFASLQARAFCGEL